MFKIRMLPYSRIVFFNDKTAGKREEVTTRGNSVAKSVQQKSSRLIVTAV